MSPGVGLIWLAVLPLALACQAGPTPSSLERADVAFAKGRFAEAGRAYHEAARNRTDQRAEALHGMARVQLASRKPEEALELFGQLASTDPVYFRERARPDYTRALHLAGRSRLTRKQIEPAIAALEALRNIDARYPELSQALAAAYTAHGDALSLRGRRTEAMDRFQQAMDVRPESADAWVGAAEILISTGRAHEALELLGDGRRHNPSDGRMRTLTFQALGAN